MCPRMVCQRRNAHHLSAESQGHGGDWLNSIGDRCRTWLWWSRRPRCFVSDRSIHLHKTRQPWYHSSAGGGIERTLREMRQRFGLLSWCRAGNSDVACNRVQGGLEVHERYSVCAVHMVLVVGGSSNCCWQGHLDGMLACTLMHPTQFHVFPCVEELCTMKVNAWICACATDSDVV